jgi:hypothetical protein
VNSFVQLTVTQKRSSEKETEKETEKKERKKEMYPRWSQLQKLSVDNVWPSFNGLTGRAPAHPTVTSSLSAV